MAGLPDPPFAEVSELVSSGVTGAVPVLPVEDAGRPGCSDVTNCSSDWSTRMAMASMGPSGSLGYQWWARSGWGSVDCLRPSCRSVVFA